MLRLKTPHYPSVNLIDIAHPEEPALRKILQELKSQSDTRYELYRADIYNDNIFGPQPVFTVEMIHLPDEDRFGVEWLDGMEWIDCDSYEEAIETWLEHHARDEE
jgi:hypothetical protein